MIAAGRPDGAHIWRARGADFCGFGPHGIASSNATKMNWGPAWPCTVEYALRWQDWRHAVQLCQGAD